MGLADIFKKDYDKWKEDITKAKLKKLDIFNEVFRIKGTAKTLFVLEYMTKLKKYELRITDFSILTGISIPALIKILNHLINLGLVEKVFTLVEEPRKEKVHTYRLTKKGDNFLDRSLLGINGLLNRLESSP